MQETFAILPRAGRGSIAYHRLNGPQNAAKTAAQPGLIFLGGFMSDMTGIKAAWLEEFAAGAGLAYLRFDYTGHGHSEGAFTEGTIGSWLQDVLDVLDTLTKGPQILIGSSMGGWLALLAALQRPDRVAGLIGVAAAPDFTEELVLNGLSETEREALQRDGQVAVPNDYDEEPYIITRALIEEARTHLLLGAPIALTCPVHLLHGIKDPDVPWQTALRITEKLESDDVAVTLIKDGDHRLARPQDLSRIRAAVMDMITTMPKI
jgi:pimeloyl-ACP methyl ester carboxylesterase